MDAEGKRNRWQTKSLPKIQLSKKEDKIYCVELRLKTYFILLDKNRMTFVCLDIKNKKRLSFVQDEKMYEMSYVKR